MSKENLTKNVLLLGSYVKIIIIAYKYYIQGGYYEGSWQSASISNILV